MADKKATKLARREKKEARAKAKAERTGASPAQEAEAVRQSSAEDLDEVARRLGVDGSIGGDTAAGRPEA